MDKGFRTRKTFLRWLRPRLTRSRGRPSKCGCPHCSYFNRAVEEAFAVAEAEDGNPVALRELAKSPGLICNEHYRLLRRTWKASSIKRKRKAGLFQEGVAIHGTLHLQLALEVLVLASNGTPKLAAFSIVADRFGESRDAVRDAYYRYVKVQS